MKTKKSILKITLITGITTIIIACGQSSSNHVNKESSDHQNISKSDHQTISKEQATKMLNSYLEIKDALVKTDGEAASKAARKLVEALGEHQDELAQKIRFDAEHISETKDAGHQREHFNTLSDNIYALVKATGANDSKLYRQYCPMAMDNKGAYWLSAEKQVNNPYFGDKMLHCGSVKEELK